MHMRLKIDQPLGDMDRDADESAEWKDLPIRYRMDRYGALFIETLDGEERKATSAEIQALLTENPSLILRLAQRC
ncbi:MAG: hypothetical protein ACPGO3_02485 [Magnetospiraceae bacterium]